MSKNLREFFDDPAIADADVLYRAVSPFLIDDWDSFSGQDEDIPSRAWQDQKEEEAAKWGLMPCASVAVARILRDHNCDIVSWLENFFSLEHGVVETTAGEVRQAISLRNDHVPQGVMLHPTAKQPWHAVVWSKSGSKRNKTEMKALRLKSHWVRPPAQLRSRHPG
jgi:hypothetical protein